MMLNSLFSRTLQSLKTPNSLIGVVRVRYFSTEEPTNTNNQKNYEDNVKKKILEASLSFVPSLGWSAEALAKGAESLGYPGVAHGMFERGGFDLVLHVQNENNAKLIKAMTSITAPPSDKGPSDSSGSANPSPSKRKLIEDAVRTRLEMIIPYTDTWPQALAVASLPANVPTSLANLLTLVDDILYYAGDTSVDMSWYARRVALAGIYKATELYLVQDKSPAKEATWQFLARRMDHAEQAHAAFVATENAGQTARDFASSAFITARNMLGLSWNR